MLNNVKTVMMSTRPPFLLLPMARGFLGLAVTTFEEQAADTLSIFLVIIGAISAHVCVNTHNEYQDFKSSLDFNTEKTPFSGGDGALVENPQGAQSISKTNAIRYPSLQLAFRLVRSSLRR